MRCIPYIRVVFELDLICLQQTITFVFFGVSRNLPDEFLLKLHKVKLPVLLIRQFCLRWQVFLLPGEIVKLVGLIEQPRGEILRVENPHLLFVDQYEEDTFCEEKT
jgi:hypothetical protein